jgi:hypothetical protein
MTAMVGNVSGYPNDANKIGVAKYHADGGAMGGAGGCFWLGGALRDWFVVGVGFTGTTIAGRDATLSTGGAFLLHLEGFPLFYQGGALRDFAVMADFGTGSRNLLKGSVTTAEGGTTSYAALGLLYEPIRVGKHVSAGPVVQFAYQFSETLKAALVMGGVQIAYYGGPG